MLSGKSRSQQIKHYLIPLARHPWDDTAFEMEKAGVMPGDNSKGSILLNNMGPFSVVMKQFYSMMNIVTILIYVESQLCT